MNLLPLVEKLENDSLGTIGESIFINMMPVEPVQGVMLRNKLTGTPIDHELPGYYRTDFQVIVRSYDYATGEALVKSVVTALTMMETQVGTIYFKYSRPMTKPVVFPLSDGNVLEFMVRFEVCYNEAG